MKGHLTWKKRDFLLSTQGAQTKTVLNSVVFFCDFSYIKQENFVTNSVKNLEHYYNYFKFLFKNRCYMYPLHFFFFDVSNITFFLNGNFFLTKRMEESHFDVNTSFYFFLGNIFFYRDFLYYSFFFFLFSKSKNIYFDMFFFFFINFFLSFYLLLNGNLQSSLKVTTASST